MIFPSWKCYKTREFERGRWFLKRGRWWPTNLQGGVSNSTIFGNFFINSIELNFVGVLVCVSERSNSENFKNGSNFLLGQKLRKLKHFFHEAIFSGQLDLFGKLSKASISQKLSFVPWLKNVPYTVDAVVVLL